MNNSIILKFLYKTSLGRLILKLLVQPKVSKVVGKILSSGISKCLVPYYIKKHDIKMDNIDIPKSGFNSFNDFFIRKRKKNSIDLAEGNLISPCDGFLSMVEINKETIFEIKNTKYSLMDLLNDKELAKTFKEGKALIFRLTPADYHRYCYSTDGEVLSSRKIQGVLHCVRPIALCTTPVFIQNSREYQIIKTNKFKTMIQMEVGALLVGKIENHQSVIEKKYIQKGEEKGYFEFGGSTIILLFQKNVISMKKNLFKQNEKNNEIQIQMGECIAQMNKEE